MLQIVNFILNFSTLSGIFPAVAGISCIKNKTSSFFILYCALILGFAIDIITTIMADNHLQNGVLMNVYSLIETLAFTYLLCNWIFDIRKKQVTIFLLSVYGLVWIGTAINNGLEELNQTAFIIKGILLTVLSMIFLYQLSKKSQSNILSNPLFYFATGMFIYYSATLISFASLDYFLKLSNTDAMLAWIINPIINIIANILYAIGFLLIKKSRLHVSN